MNFFRTLFSRQEPISLEDEPVISKQSHEDIKEFYFSPDELVQISSEAVLDTNSPQAIAALKHNLALLIRRAKEEGKIERFMLIRDDNHFPYHSEWTVASKNTEYETVKLSFSNALQEHQALQKANLIQQSGMAIPVDKETLDAALKDVDKDLGRICVPVHYRSTKHFTINTPLEVTGNYNTVAAYQNFTILDSIPNFLESGYGYSLSYHDAYLDVSHESLPLSDNAIVLIEEKKYSKLIENPSLADELAKKKVIVYRGEEYVAINMILSELGVLPSQMGEKFAHYDEETKTIIRQSLQDLATTNHLLYDKNHGGIHGHFTDYYDGRNTDYEDSLKTLEAFFKKEFPAYTSLFTPGFLHDSWQTERIIRTIGSDALLQVIDSYNQQIKWQTKQNAQEYKKNHDCVTPEIRQVFQNTLRQIGFYYETNRSLCSFDVQQEIDSWIIHFFQDKTVQDQLKAAQQLELLLQNIHQEPKMTDSLESSLKF